MLLQEEDRLLRELADAITFLPSSHNSNLPVCKNFITSLLQNVNEEVKKRKNEEMIMKKKKVKMPFQRKRKGLKKSPHLLLLHLEKGKRKTEYLL
jgi:hypothetical protein